MKGVLLCGGKGTRLSPLTDVTNKHLLPVGEVPMVFHPLRSLFDAGIRDILIVTGTEHMGDMIHTLGSGSKFNCKFTYKVQDEAGGIAQALLLAEDFCRSRNMCVILGDNIFNHRLDLDRIHFENSYGDGCNLFLTPSDTPDRFGVATIDGNKITKIVEKPENPESNLIVTGVYMYTPSVFDVIRTLKPSGRGELEITDVNNHYVKNGTVVCSTLNGDWCDAGTFESYHRANEMVRRWE